MDKLIAFLQLLRPVSAADAELLAQYFEPRVFKEGDYLFTGGKVCREMFFVCKGVLRIVSTNEKGIEVTHYFYRENQFSTILQSFNDEIPSPAGIQASCNAEVLAISKSKLLQLYNELPYMKDVIHQLNQMLLIEKVNIRNAYLGHDAEGQYRLFIMQHADIALRVPLKDIASYLGITPQSLSRIRKHIR